MLVAVVLSLLGLAHSFLPLFSFDGHSTTHRDITQRAVLRKTAEVCRDIAASEGQDFSLVIDDNLSADKVQRACFSIGTSSSLLSTVIYQTAIANMYFGNAKVDIVFALSAEHHFDDESFQGGRDVITAGKCSHGGSFDQTSKQDPVGGISKDDAASSHGSLHHRAADLAVDATMELLEDIRVSIGDRNFLRDRKLYKKLHDWNQYPNQYPGFGPLMKTTNADVFKDSINKLSASGGGDIPELCLSGLQLALTAVPPSSEIFVFTDAPAKDALLKSTITALIESTKSVVTFMLTEVLSSRRRRKDVHGVTSRSMSQSDVQLYHDLAQASGGQAIEVTKSNLFLATSVVEDSSASAVVTVFHVVRNPGRPDHFTFTVDRSLRNMTTYITGASSLTFNLTSSTGLSQSSSQSNGPLASVTTVGNLRRLSINTDNQTGLWEISVNSNNPYSVKVTGGNASLMVTVTGSDTVKVTEVTLFDSSGPTEVLGGGNFLVSFNGVPAGGFVVRLRGQYNSSTTMSTLNNFQRQASTQIKTSSISVTAQANNTNIEPGSTISIPFTVAIMTNGVVNNTATGAFTVRANNDRSYASISPSSITIAAGSGGNANGTVTLTVPVSAASGTDVTLTIEAENAAATDINYAILWFSVAAKATDANRPVCQVVSISGICPASSSLCASAQWQFIVNLTNGINGTGIVSITIRQGNGTLNTSRVVGVNGENITVAIYRASCCSQNVVLAAVDREGNVGTCVGQASTSTTTTPPMTTAAPLTVANVTNVLAVNPSASVTTVNTASTGGHTLSISHCLCISVVVSLLWK
ncbi:hypothetical protein PAMA_016233 [Pampus argenteus]